MGPAGTSEDLLGGGSVAARAVQAGKDIGSGNRVEIDAVVGGSEEDSATAGRVDACDCCCAWRCDL